MPKRWPLHPQPYSWETLESYVRRLAGCYGFRYETFCLHALGIPIADAPARRFKDAGPPLLQRLSEGTGVAVSQLEGMTQERVWRQLIAEMEAFAATPEGRIALERARSPNTAMPKSDSGNTERRLPFEKPCFMDIRADAA